jgi:hypothetical protein
MLIQEEIENLCRRGRLVALSSLDWRAPIKRRVYVSPDLHRFLNQQSASPETNRDRRRLQRLFDRFISGQVISVALKRYPKGSDLKRLSPKHEEVWEFKVRSATPQLRIFGRFAEVNEFVALTGPVDRSNCDYPSEIDRCQQEWNSLFPGYSPVRGSKASDYISTNVVPL